MELRPTHPEVRLLTPSFEGGGSERVCLLLANQWAAEGKHVEVLVIRGAGAFRGLVDPRVRVVCAGCGRIREAVTWLVLQLSAYPQCPVLAFGSDIGALVGILKRLGLVRSPIIYREWSVPLENVPARRLWIYPQAIAYADGVVAQTLFVKRMLGVLLRRRVPLVRIFNPFAFRAGNRLSPTSADGLRLLAVGRLASEKRLDRLLNTLSQTSLRSKVSKLTIAGDGLLREKLEALVTERNLSGVVEFKGFVANVSDLYASADVFVLSSDYEGMPNALIEAVAAGCRVVAAGGAAVYELLSAIGLPDCYLEGQSWAQDFEHRLVHVTSIPEDRWMAARAQLAARTNIVGVASEYYGFARQISNGNVVVV